jgi:hypothetical protein
MDPLVEAREGNTIMQGISAARATLALVMLLLATATATDGREQVTPPRDAILRVQSAKRTERFDDGSTKLTVRNSGKDVILLLDLAGIGVEDFNVTPASEVFLVAGDRRLEPSFRTAGDWKDADAKGVKEDRWVVVIVPRNTLTFSLHFGKRPLLVFKADTAIASTLP